MTVILCTGGDLGPSERVLCVRATFDILTGPGEFLTYDPGTATRTLLDIMPEIDLVSMYRVTILVGKWVGLT